jgi:hypothetical protein
MVVGSTRFTSAQIGGSWAMPDRPAKITFAEMRASGARGLRAGLRGGIGRGS